LSRARHRQIKRGLRLAALGASGPLCFPLSFAAFPLFGSGPHREPSRHRAAAMGPQSTLKGTTWPCRAAGGRVRSLWKRRRRAWEVQGRGTPIEGTRCANQSRALSSRGALGFETIRSRCLCAPAPRAARRPPRQSDPAPRRATPTCPPFPDAALFGRARALAAEGEAWGCPAKRNVCVLCHKGCSVLTRQI